MDRWQQELDSQHYLSKNSILPSPSSSSSSSSSPSFRDYAALQLDDYDHSPPQSLQLPGSGYGVGAGGDNDDDGGMGDDEDATWLVIIVLATAVLVLLASAIRTCSERVGWMNPPSASATSSSPGQNNNSSNGGRGGLGALLSTHLGIDFGGSSQGQSGQNSQQGGPGAGRGQLGGPGRYHYTGPHTYPRDEDADPEQTFTDVDERWALMTEGQRHSYVSARAFEATHPPLSVPTDISLSQHISIQEKGVAAWEFEEAIVSSTPLETIQPNERPKALQPLSSQQQQPLRRQQAHVQVHDRTEISFPPMIDMEASVQTNLPMPKVQEVYYWEVKMFEKHADTVVAVGVATKPYPNSRLPGWNRHSIAYNSRDGSKYCNSIFQGYPYAPCFYEGDVIGCGYRPRTGTLFFTRNGKRMEDAYMGFGGVLPTSLPEGSPSISPSSIANLFPTVGATGPCVLHVNLGQSGFVFVEANVKKWGLAPASGSLAPPPAYGRERGSILLESGVQSPTLQQHPQAQQQRARPPLKSSQSRARIEAAEVLVQIDEDVDARVPGARKHQFVAGESLGSGSGSGSNNGNATTGSGGTAEGKRSSLLNLIQSATSPTPPPPSQPQNFSLSNMHGGDASLDPSLLPPPEYEETAPESSDAVSSKTGGARRARAESEDEATALIAETISRPVGRIGAVRSGRKRSGTVGSSSSASRR
ncbi:Rsp5p-dependent ubiquitination, sorting of cargo proteins at the multivesicular body [Gryganskiella cystojenkinii]|nr:Rsp5p-dependent ubiquitination, sorting of cargo proteins at the multivesicular body [Gryganskiella cystojenkinii]